jgi:hypothetical protein
MIEEARGMDAKVGKRDESGVPEPGTGLCPEAQADGVPCTALGRDCEICEKAFPESDPETET